MLAYIESVPVWTRVVILLCLTLVVLVRGIGSELREWRKPPTAKGGRH